MSPDDPNISLPYRPRDAREAALDQLARLRPRLETPPQTWPPEFIDRLNSVLDQLEAEDPTGPARLADELLEKQGLAPHSLAALRQSLTTARKGANPQRNPIADSVENC